jgi:UDP-glucose 4-epimerase
VPYNQVFDESFEDMPRRVPDISKIGKFIGYRPKVHLDEIIEHVVAFWADNPDQKTARDLTQRACHRPQLVTLAV